jgi:hypothetical protein
MSNTSQISGGKWPPDSRPISLRVHGYGSQSFTLVGLSYNDVTGKVFFVSGSAFVQNDSANSSLSLIRFNVLVIY